MLDKAIQSGKEHRKPYYDTRRFDMSCRCHGSCIWCQKNRYHNTLIKIERLKAQEREM